MPPKPKVTENRELSSHCQLAQLTAASPALRLVWAVAGEINAASIDLQTQNGTAGGVHTLRHHLPRGAVWSAARIEYLLRVSAEDGGASMSVSGLNCVESCLNCHLRSRSFFCDLSQDSIEAFNRIKHAAVFPEHAVVLAEGQSPCGIFMLCQGRAKLSTTSRDGKTLIVRLAEPGEILGLHAVVTGGRYELTVETMQPCQLNYVGREDLLRFLKDHADAALHATQHLARDCSDAYGVARTIGLSHSVSERFARFLLETAADGEVSNGTVRVRLAMTHEEISQLVGTSRETITRLLSEFRRNETAELKGSMLIIHNHPALKNMVRA